MLEAPSTSVPMGSDGAPQWPTGFVGSISHSAGLAFAAVAATSDVASIGIDVEKLLSAEVAQQLASTVATPAEREKFKLGSPKSALVLSILFSAKEAAYNCLYPNSLQRLEFEDIELDSIEGHAP